MEIFLTKFVTLFVYPFGLLLCLLIGTALLLFCNRPHGARWLLVLSLLVMFIGGNGRLAYTLIRSLENDFAPVAVADAPRSDVIVVLGGGLGLPHSPRLYPDLGGSSDRLLQALRLYRAGKADHILLTGGNVFPQPGLESEAYYARQLLALWGVPPEVVATETESRNTLQNAEYSAPILKRNQWDEVLLVTSATHMSRSVLAFRRVGVEVVPFPSDFTAVHYSAPEIFSWVPTLGALGGTTQAVHEYLGRVYYWLRT